MGSATGFAFDRAGVIFTKARLNPGLPIGGRCPPENGAPERDAYATLPLMIATARIRRSNFASSPKPPNAAIKVVRIWPVGVFVPGAGVAVTTGADVAWPGAACRDGAWVDADDEPGAADGAGAGEEPGVPDGAPDVVVVPAAGVPGAVAPGAAVLAPAVGAAEAATVGAGAPVAVPTCPVACRMARTT